MDKLLDTYDQTIAAQNDTIEESNRYFKVMFGTSGNLKNVDQFLQNEKLRQFVFTAYGIDEPMPEERSLRRSSFKFWSMRLALSS